MIWKQRGKGEIESIWNSVVTGHVFSYEYILKARFHRYSKYFVDYWITEAGK